MTKEEYSRPLHVLNQSSVGQHIRHILEFYIELDKGYTLGTVAYDNRIRNLQFEIDQELVIRELENITKLISNYDLEKQLLNESNHGSCENESVFSKTSCRREVVYALDHTVHHLAIVKIAIQTTFNHINLDVNLGIAPSTLRNNIKLCAQ